MDESETYECFGRGALVSRLVDDSSVTIRVTQKEVQETSRALLERREKLFA